jgi:hypothetical protein
MKNLNNFFFFFSLQFLTAPEPAEFFDDNPQLLSRFLNTEPKFQTIREETIYNIPEEYGDFLRNIKVDFKDTSEKLEKLANGIY